MKPTTNVPSKPTPPNPNSMSIEHVQKLDLDQFDKLADGVELDHIPAADQKTIRLVIYHREMLQKQAESRVPRAVQALNYIADLMDHNPSEAQRAAILAEVGAAFKAIEQRFAGEPKKEEKSFSLPTA